jgi:hypothetical protein
LDLVLVTAALVERYHDDLQYEMTAVPFPYTSQTVKTQNYHSITIHGHLNIQSKYRYDECPL